jgi:hypothetical protein
MTCERHIWARGEDRRCSQVVGLIRWWDANGKEHAACRNHVDIQQLHWPPADPPEPEWLDPMTMAKAEAMR